MRKIYLALLGLPLAAGAQLFTTGNQQFVSQAVNGTMVVVEQTYQLEDTATGRRFGRYGSPAFGAAYTVGVKVPGGLLAPLTVEQPWVGDANFERYSQTHRPVLFEVRTRELSDSAFALVTDTEYLAAAPGIVMLTDSAAQGPLSAGDGYRKGNFTGETEGWLVWLTAPQGLTSETATVSPTLLSYKKQLDLAGDTAGIVAVEPPSQPGAKPWGGVFVVPRQTAPGVLTFSLAGLIAPLPPGGEQEEGEGAWQLLPLSATVGRQAPAAVASTTEELTPIE